MTSWVCAEHALRNRELGQRAIRVIHRGHDAHISPVIGRSDKIERRSIERNIKSRRVRQSLPQSEAVNVIERGADIEKYRRQNCYAYGREFRQNRRFSSGLGAGRPRQ